jgi:hypothetical protein
VRAPAAALLERAGRRERRAERDSDAGRELTEQQQREFEPLDEVVAARHLVLGSDRSTPEAIDDIEALLDSRLGGEPRPARLA